MGAEGFSDDLKITNLFTAYAKVQSNNNILGKHQALLGVAVGLSSVSVCYIAVLGIMLVVDKDFRHYINSPLVHYAYTLIVFLNIFLISDLYSEVSTSGYWTLFRRDLADAGFVTVPGDGFTDFTHDENTKLAHWWIISFVLSVCTFAAHFPLHYGPAAQLIGKLEKDVISEAKTLLNTTKSKASGIALSSVDSKKKTKTIA